MKRLLLEIGTEAIPAGYVPPALDALAEKTREGLADLRLPAEGVRALGTAKRLVLVVDKLGERQEDLTREVLGPRADAAFRDGRPTPAAEGFARKNGVPVESLDRVVTEKGEFVRARVHEAGKPTEEVLPALLTRLVETLTWPKTMVWNESRFRFPRPLRWVVCLLDRDVLPVTVAGLAAGRDTRGHWLLGPGPRPVEDAGRLAPVLAEAGVVLDPAERRRRIEEGLAAEATRLGGRVVMDAGLLDEVVFLAEHPTVLSGSFDREFLALPREVTITAMRSHQRYFAVEEMSGALLPRFLVVCDGRWDDASQVVAGNERVLRARLADARFYWDMDRKTGLERLAESLGQVVWLESAGSIRDKAERVATLVDRLGTAWYGGEWAGQRALALRAARLAKADLASEMIRDGKEFTGLQGVIGARYAEAAGEPGAVVQALREQYLPRGAGDPLPESVPGTVLAVADRLDTIAGCWAAGFTPSGSQDPYALRRAGNGIVRILLEKNLHVSLAEHVRAAVELLPAALRGEGPRGAGLGREILDFLADRTAFFLKEHGMPYDVVDAVLAADADDPGDALARAKALESIRGEADLERLVVGFKRAANILKGVDLASLPSASGVDWSGAEAAEKDLHGTVGRVGPALEAARRGRDYPAMLRLLLELRAPIDTFFDAVMVMSENPAERGRRLALLVEARGLFHHLFDPSRIVLEGEGAGR